MDTVAPERNRKNKTPEVPKAHREGEISARNTQDEEKGKTKNLMSEIAAHMSAFFLEKMPKFNFRDPRQGKPWRMRQYVRINAAAQRKMRRALTIAAPRLDGVEKAAELNPLSHNSEINSKGKEQPVSGIVCVLCEFFVGHNVEQNIYLFDPSCEEELFDDDDIVDDDGFVPRPPNLRFHFPGLGSYAFCALGSTLYLIEPALDWVNPKNKSIYSFDLSSVNPSRFSDSLLCKSSFFPRGEMLYAKRLPRATPTPDGKKILIFSIVLNHNNPYRGLPHPDHDIAEEIDFELYDPLTDFFKRLPQIPHNWYRSSITVEFSRFINNSTFLVQTSEVGTFSLDIDDLNSGWKKLDRSFCEDEDVVLNCVTKDGFIFSPFDACEEDDASVIFPYPLFPFYGDFESVSFDAFGNNFRLASSYVTLLDHDEKNRGGDNIHLCVVQMGVNDYTESPLMVVDVLSIDVNTYREEKKKGNKNVEITSQNVRSLKLRLGDEPCSRIFTHIVFSFPRGT